MAQYRDTEEILRPGHPKAAGRPSLPPAMAIGARGAARQYRARSASLGPPPHRPRSGSARAAVFIWRDGRYRFKRH